MSTEKKSVIRKIVDANKEFAKTIAGETQDIAAATVDYNREIWLAGLGAFTQAREEGSKAFDKLVERGHDFETRTRDAIDEKSASAKGVIGDTFEKITNPSLTLEDIFDTRVARAIKRMGIPTASTLKALSEQLLEVSEKLNSMSEGDKPAKETTKKATKKAAPKAKKSAVSSAAE